MKRYIVAAAVAALVLAWQLGSSGARAQNAAGGWGMIKGQVIFGGDQIPERQKLKVDKDKEHCLGEGDLYDETWVVRKKDKGVRDVFIWLEDPDNPLPIHPNLQNPPKNDVSIDQPRCQFVPHALAMRKGQALLAKNSSPISHNFKYGGHPLVNPGGNFLMSAKCKPIPIKNLKADKLPVQVACNIHPWMQAWVRVFDHPYYAVTGEDGRFEIKLAPAGNFRLKVWHPGSGWLGGAKGRNGQAITINADQTTDVGQLKLTKAR
jgi:hypothetical protein